MRTAFSLKPLRLSTVSALLESMVEIAIRIIYPESEVLARIIVLYFKKLAKMIRISLESH